MKAAFVAALAAFSAFGAALAHAQIDIGAGVGPDLFNYADRKREKRAAPPIALALDMAFGPTVWTQVQLSTAGPVVEMSKLVREGYYKLELIELILMSAQAGQPLKKTLEKRKKGEKLSQIALDYRLDYDKVYESALIVQGLIDKEYLPRIHGRQVKRKYVD